MSIRHMSAIWDDPYYTRADKTKLLVALSIADNARGEDGRAWPSIEYIARKARSSVRGAQEAIRELERDARLEVIPFAGQKGTNLYVVKIPPATVAPPCNEAAVKAADEAADGCTQIIKNHQESERTSSFEKKFANAQIPAIKTPIRKPPIGAAPLPQLEGDLLFLADDWKRWQQHCAEKGKPLTALQSEAQIALLWKMTYEESRESIKAAIEGGFTRFLLPKHYLEESRQQPANCGL